jgi:O-antigen/teichoic acid export membrane protein
MNRLWQKLKSNKFLISFSILATGSIISQIISLLISPITTRLFTPEHFGHYTVVVTAISLFGPIICLKYDMSIVVAKTEKDTYAIIKLCLLTLIPLSILLSILYGLTFIRNNFVGLQLLGYILAIFILLIGYGLNNILMAHNNKNSLYKLISSVTVIKSAINNTLLILSGLCCYY